MNTHRAITLFAILALTVAFSACSFKLGSFEDDAKDTAKKTDTSKTERNSKEDDADETSKRSGSGARLAHAELGQLDDGDFIAISEFPTDVPKILCEWSVEDLDSSTTIRGVWIAVDSGGAAPPNYKIDEASLEIESDQTGTFSLSMPDNGWPEGEYRLDIYLGGSVVKKIPFYIAS